MKRTGIRSGSGPRRRRGLSPSPLGSARSSLRTSSRAASGRLPTGNRARKARTPSEFARIYGSKARVRWVKSLPCVAANAMCQGAIENAHVGTGGMGRKADADKIVPLCHWHHRVLHQAGAPAFSVRHRVDLAACCADVERAWRAYVGAAAA